MVIGLSVCVERLSCGHSERRCCKDVLAKILKAPAFSDNLSQLTDSGLTWLGQSKQLLGRRLQDEQMLLKKHALLLIVVVQTRDPNKSPQVSLKFNKLMKILLNR